MEREIIAPLPGLVHEIDLGTHRLTYADLGTGDPVLFLHGGLMDHRSWGNQLSLANAFRMILPDTRGHGRSTGADLPVTYAAFADDVVALMDRLGLPSAAVVGFSDGGCSALHLSLHSPDRVTGLVLIGTPYDMASYNPDVIEQMRAMTAEGLLGAAGPLLKELVAMLREHMSGEQWSAYWQRVVKGLWLMEPDLRLSAFADLPIPTLILHGENELSISRRSSEELAASIPNCTLLLVPGAGHAAAQENPAFVNDAILRFLRR